MSSITEVFVKTSESLEQGSRISISMEPGKRASDANLVAQIFNLLYRRIAFGRAWKNQALGTTAAADCKSAIQQIENLRYV